MNSINLLDKYLEERNQQLGAITARLENDPSVKAAWLIGSLGRGDGDALSDIDLWVVVEDDPLKRIIKQPRQFTAQIGNPILFLDAPQNAPEGGAYLMACYDGVVAPHIVDWYWQPFSSASLPGQVRYLFDRAGLARRDQPVRFADAAANMEMVKRPMHFISFFWMMLMISAKHTYRAPWDETLPFLPYLLDPMGSAQRFLDRDEVRDVIQIPSSRLPGEKVALLRQLANQMSDLMIRISDKGEDVPTAVLPGIDRYLNFLDLILKDKAL